MATHILMRYVITLSIHSIASALGIASSALPIATSALAIASSTRERDLKVNPWKAWVLKMVSTLAFPVRYLRVSIGCSPTSRWVCGEHLGSGL